MKSLFELIVGVKIELVFAAERGDLAEIESSHSCGMVLISRRLSLELGWSVEPDGVE